MAKRSEAKSTNFLCGHSRNFGEKNIFWQEASLGDFNFASLEATWKQTSYNP